MRERHELFVARPADGPADFDLVAVVRAALPWAEIGRPDAAEAAEASEPDAARTSGPAPGEEPVARTRPSPRFWIQTVPELWPAGDVIALSVVGTAEEIASATRLLEAAGLSVSRGDQTFQLHQL
jgi:hypothetical protein